MIFDNEIRNINYLEQLYDQSYIRNDPLIQPVASDVITTNTFLHRVEEIDQQKCSVVRFWNAIPIKFK